MCDAYVCDTPFQLLSALNLRVNLFSKQNATLFVVNQFSGAQICADKIRKLELFDDVYLVSPNNLNIKARYYFEKIIEITKPQNLLSRWANCILYQGQFSRLFFSFYNRTQIMLRELNPAAEVVFFDEGTGSYSGNVFPTAFKKHKIFYKIFFRIDLNLLPKSIYLNKIDAAMFSNVKKLELPRLDENSMFSRIVDIVFAPEKNYLNVYDGKKIIYLSQPIDNSNSNASLELAIIKNIDDALNNNLLVRIHPRQNEDIFNVLNIKIDNTRALWELIIKNCCSDDTILIGKYSSSQFMPKILYDKEPYLIFIYELFGSENSQYENEINKLKKLYRNPSKIVVPKSIDEVVLLIHNINH